MDWIKQQKKDELDDDGQQVIREAGLNLFLRLE